MTTTNRDMWVDFPNPSPFRYNLRSKVIEERRLLSGGCLIKIHYIFKNLFNSKNAPEAHLVAISMYKEGKRLASAFL